MRLPRPPRPHAGIAALVLLGACTRWAGPGAGPSNTGGWAPITDDPFANPFVLAEPDTVPSGVYVRVSEIPAGDAAPARGDVPASSPLPSFAAESLLVRLAGEPILPQPPPAFRFATRSMPPPRPGDTRSASLTSSGPGVPASEPLTPLRIVSTSPRGTVGSVSQLSVAFSSPMVPLSKLEAAPAGVRLTPEQPGAWRWLDPFTLVFEATGGLPGATRFTAEVPAGLTDANGRVLTEGARWTFSTRAPVPVNVVSAEAPDLDRPVLIVSFDQRVDGGAMLPFLRLAVDSVDVPLRLATAAELTDPLVRRAVGAREPDRVVAVRAEEGRPAGSPAPERQAVLRVLAGAPSLEGTERTDAETTRDFRIRARLQVVEHGCGRSDECRADRPWTIRFNQPLALPADSGRSWVRIEPELPGATIQVWSTHIIVLGAASPGTRYTVHLDPSIATWSGDVLGTAPRLTFAIGPAAPNIWLPGDRLALLPADGPSTYTMLAEGLDSVRVRVRAVTIEDFRKYLFGWSSGRVDAALGADRMLMDVTLPVATSARGPAEVALDLERALKASGGHVVVTAQPPASHASLADSTAFSIWVEREGPVIDVAEDGAALIVRASARRDGRALESVRLALFAPGRSAGDSLRLLAEARTDADGVARFDVAFERRGPDWLIVATHNGVETMVPARLNLWEFRRDLWRPDLASHFVTDRPIYQPGDTVRFAGWLRRREGVGREPSAPAAGDTVMYRATGPRGERIDSAKVTVERNGRVQVAFPLPPGTNSGRGYIQLWTGGMYTSLMFEIEEVRRPSYEVALRIDPGPYTPGKRIVADLSALYFTGGGLADARVEWQVGSSTAWFVPPGVDGYTFGGARGWLRRTPRTSFEARTGATGETRLAIDVDSVVPAFSMYLSAQATVTDLDDQRRTVTGGVLVHPADVLVGLRTPARFVRADESFIVDATVVDFEGRPVAGRPISLGVMRQDRAVRSGRLDVRESRRAGCDLVSRTEPVSCTFDGLAPGDYVVAASVRDTLGRRSDSQLAVRVASETMTAGALSRRDTLAVTTDRDDYEPGDTASIRLSARTPRAEGLVTVRRGGLIESMPVRLVNGAGVLRLPIADRHVPNVTLTAVLSGGDGVVLKDDHRIRVAATTRRLAVGVEPASPEVAPGGRTSVVVTVTDPSGKPVGGADIVLSGIDEALLALTRVPTSDPIDELYRESGAGVIDIDLRSHRSIEQPTKSTRAAGRTGAVGGIVIDVVTGMPIEDAWVELAGTGMGAWTRANGSYRIDAIAPGDHRLVARARGYITNGAGAVRVRGGMVTRLHVPLTTPSDLLRARGSRVELRAVAFTASKAVALDELVVSGEADLIAIPPVPPGTPVDATAQGASPMRRNFTPVAAFVVDARTDEGGRAEIPIDVPDNLTRYRLRAVVAGGDRRFGAGAATVTARLPIMARPVPPRFLNQGDRFDLRVLVENRSGAAREVDVAVRAFNGGVPHAAGRRVVVPADDRVELRFAAMAEAPGVARFQVAASAVEPGSGAVAVSSDAAEAVIPVLTPAATESFAAYGHLDTGRPVAFPVRLPGGTLPGQSRVEVGFATTAAQGLRDALFFLWSCFFDLPEVRASRTMALSALSRVPAGALPWPRAEIEASIRSDVTSLARSQLRDGGWSIWPARFDADPFITVQVADALERARAFGVAVPDRTVESALEWLRRLDDIGQGAPGRAAGLPVPLPRDFPLEGSSAVQSYALDVRRRLGDDVGASAAALLHSYGASALAAEALAWLLPALARDTTFVGEADDVRRELTGRIVRSAGTAGVVSPYNAGARQVYSTARRTDAVVLGALVWDSASPDLVAALARGLMAHRVHGRWSNTQENAYAVAALADYLSTAEAIEPALTARAWAGPRMAGEHRFDGRSDDRQELSIPADSLGSAGDRIDLVIARQGQGRLYYRAGFSYALAGSAPAVASGFEVDRFYEAVDDSADVRQGVDGTWHVRLGARVRVVVTVAAAGPRYHVAVVDHLPAGLEAANPALAGTSGMFDRPEWLRESTFRWFPAAHVNIRSDRFEAFADRLEAGRYEVTYVALATTPGDFMAPAARAEELFAAETFGRAASGRVIIETTAKQEPEPRR